MTTSQHAARDADNLNEMARCVGAAVEQQLRAKGVVIATLTPGVHEPASGDSELHIDATFADEFLIVFGLPY